MAHRRSWLLLLVPALAAALVSSVAQAQREPREYRTWIERAVSEYDAGRWEEARANFRRAHELFPNARTLRGIGMTSFELRQYVDAIRNLTASIADTRRPLTAEQRTEVNELLERARAYVGRYRLAVEPAPPESTVSVDDQPAVLDADGVLLLDVGQHRLIVRVAGRQVAQRVVQVRGGEDEPLRLAADAGAAGTAGTAGTRSGGTSTATPPDAPSEPPPSMQPDELPDRPETLPEPRSTRSRRHARRPARASHGTPGAAVALLAIGGGLGAGTIVSAVYLADRASAASECDGTGPQGPCSNEDAITGQRDLGLGLTLGLGAAALVSAGIGLVMIVTSGGDEPTGGRATLRCGPLGAGVTCGGSF